MTKRQSETVSPTPEYPACGSRESSGSKIRPSWVRAIASTPTTAGGTTASTLSGRSGGATGSAGFSLSLELLAHGQLVPPSQHEQSLACISHRSGGTHAPAGTTRAIWSSSPSSSPVMERRVIGIPINAIALIKTTIPAKPSEASRRGVNVQPAWKPLEKTFFLDARPSREDCGAGAALSHPRPWRNHGTRPLSWSLRSCRAR